MTAPTGKPRGRPKGCAKTGGRVAGKSIDRAARVLVSNDLAGSILATFEQLGGTDDMVAWARDNRTVFYTQILSRMMPAPQKDDPDFVQNNIQINNMSDVEAARRVAFALSKAIYENPAIDVTPAPMTPQQACSWRDPTPPDMPPLLQPEPVDDPDRERWASELPLSVEERRDQALVRETKDCTLANYRGGPGEQGGPGPVQRQSVSKASVSEIRRRQLL